MATETRLRLPRSPFLDAVRKSGLLAPDDLVAFFGRADLDEATIADPIKLGALFVRAKLLTKYQVMQLLNGKTQGFILGGYTILHGIRQDRVGMVFLAEDRRSKKYVSIKVLPTDRVSDETVLRAFVSEVRSAARVDHPTVARVLDMDIHNGIHFVVTEYVPAPTLDKVIAEKGPLDANQAAQVAAQVAIALRQAHDCGIIHRDVKPGNIALLPTGAVKLIDLGLTHMLESPWKQVTRRINTKEYAEEIDHVAPEQAWACEPDGRSDIYSLGSTLYYLLTGQSPFPGSAAEKMSQRQLYPVPRPSLIRPEIPRELDEIVQRMGSQHPHQRYQSASEVIRAFHSWIPLAQWLSLGLELPEKRPTVGPSTATPPPRAGLPGAKPSGSLFGRVLGFFTRPKAG